MKLAEKFSVSHVFSSNMVIQRDERIRVWGWAPPEEEGNVVCAGISDLHGDAVIQNGEWCVELDGTLPACAEGETLTVYGADGAETAFENVLVGDVYFCIGQSNVRYPLEAILCGAPEGYPGRDCVITDKENIRLNLSSIHDADGNDIYPVRGTTELCRDVRHGRKWQLPSEGAREFSALGFFVAQVLVQRTDNSIPIGIIEIDADGQSLGMFMPNELADRLHTDDLVDGVYKCMWHIGPEPSRYVYNHFIYPYQRIGHAGIIWYQGESDFNEVNCPVYAKNYAALMEELRRRFDLHKHRDFPVYIVELPASYPPYEGWPEGELWAYIDYGNIRPEMGKIPNLLPNSYIAASSDLWLDERYWNSIHPYCKYPQAERIADIMMAVEYGAGDLEHCAGPQMTRVKYDGERACVVFRYVADGVTSAGSSDIRGFEVRDAAGNWKAPADVREYGDENGDGIEDTVELTSDGEITGVRYNARSTNAFPRDVNLCSSEGVPAIAFIDLKNGEETKRPTGINTDNYMFVDL